MEKFRIKRHLLKAFLIFTGSNSSILFEKFRKVAFITELEFIRFPERNIQLENIEVTHSEHHGLAIYIETHVTGEITTKRKSSAIFLFDKEKALWLHLIENWI